LSTKKIHTNAKSVAAVHLIIDHILTNPTCSCWGWEIIIIIIIITISTTAHHQCDFTLVLDDNNIDVDHDEKGKMVITA